MAGFAGLSGRIRPAPFGHRISDFTGPLRFTMSRLKWQVIALPTRAEVLDFYLSINGGGTPHTPKELEKVRQLRQALQS